MTYDVNQSNKNDDNLRDDELSYNRNNSDNYKDNDKLDDDPDEDTGFNT